MSIQDLMAQRAEIDRRIAAAKAAKSDETVASVVALADEAGMPLDELAAHLLSCVNKRLRSAKKTARNPGAAKYQQVGGNATWSGRGVKPTWFKAGDYRVL